MIFRKRNPGCDGCKHYRKIDDTCDVEEEFVDDELAWKGDDYIVTGTYAPYCHHKNRNRRCRDFEAKEGK